MLIIACGCSTEVRLFTTSKVYKIWTSFPLTVCISAIKRLFIQQSSPQAGECRGERTQNVEGLKGGEKRTPPKALDPSLIESRGMAAD